MSDIKLTFIWGTAFDLFISLQILHDPAKYGVRPAWAAGVRSRLSNGHRETLEQAHYAVKTPLEWVLDLPGEKEPRNVIWQLSQIPAEERLKTLVIKEHTPQALAEVLLKAQRRREYTEEDVILVQDEYRKQSTSIKDKEARLILDTWVDAEEFGKRYLEAVEAYHQAFFAEDAQRIQPKLKAAIERAQDLAQESTVDELVLTLSQGVRFEAEFDIDELILVPSFWITPLVIYDHINAETGVFVFGARPEDESLVPGEQVPDAMLRALKTLADPTRLKILHYLANEQITPADLARRLRLRAPTVTHHLNALRLAGLVYLSIGEDGEKQYQTRLEMIDKTFDSLRGFIEKETNHNG